MKIYYDLIALAKLTNTTPQTLARWCRESEKYLNPYKIECQRIGNKMWVIQADEKDILILKDRILNHSNKGRPPKKA